MQLGGLSWGSVVSSPLGFGAEPQAKTYFRAFWRPENASVDIKLHVFVLQKTPKILGLP